MPEGAAVSAARSGRAPAATDSPFHVPSFLHVLGGLVQRHPDWWIGLGRLETNLLAERLAERPVRLPVYVCGLARSGSTLLHEIVASHPGLATHRVKDYPMVLTPYWWRQATARVRPSPPRERAHADGMLIAPDSPEALEEMVWTAFFPRCHDPSTDNTFTAASRHPHFESFYRAHLGKLVLAENATRYVAKANYHVARIPYLLRLFPDARFILPIREPAGHIASLARQHARFSEGERKHPRALAYMQRSGHFEFGLDRRPIHLGDAGRVLAVRRAWAAGAEVRGWARYWAMVHDHLFDLLASNPAVRSATRVVRFEDLCASPAETIRGLMRHCELPEADAVVEHFAPRVRRPDYYEAAFSDEEVAAIREETAAAAGRWGY